MICLKSLQSIFDWSPSVCYYFSIMTWIFHNVDWINLKSKILTLCASTWCSPIRIYLASSSILIFYKKNEEEKSSRRFRKMVIDSWYGDFVKEKIIQISSKEILRPTKVRLYEKKSSFFMRSPLLLFEISCATESVIHFCPLFTV